ncbi:MAG: hypothetical protein M3380_10910 [Chloroflexota bacterium]|nr:hypothetical protein [Chloroflexota bacterium]
MSSFNKPAAGLVAAAEAALEQAWGLPVHLTDEEALTHNRDVYRFRLAAGSPHMPTTVVVKAAGASASRPYDVHAPEWPAPAWLLFNEWAGLQFLAQIADAPRLSPRLYAGDRQGGLVVMEDLGTGDSLYTLLVHGDVTVAERGIIDMATLLGRLHALTLGREGEFDHVREGLGPRITDGWYHRYAWLAEGFHRTVATLGITAAPGVTAELHALIRTMQRSGPFRAYTHGDASPVNFLYRESGLHLFDLEMSGYRPALLEGAYFRMHFPLCWSGARLPRAVVARAEASYRLALTAGSLAAGNDETFSRALVEACAYWALDHCHFFLLPTLLREDVPMQLVTMRQALLARFDTMAETAAAFGYLEAIGASIGAMAIQLRKQWGPALGTLPYYPVFQEGLAQPGA